MADQSPRLNKSIITPGKTYPDYEVGGPRDWYDTLRGHNLQLIVATLMDKATVHERIKLVAESIASGDRFKEGLTIGQKREKGMVFRWRGGDGTQAQFFVAMPPRAFATPHLFNQKIERAFAELAGAVQPEANGGNGSDVGANNNGPAPGAKPNAPEATGGGNPPPPKPLRERVDEYRKANGNMGETKFANACGVAITSLARLYKGESVRGNALERVEAVLAGTAVSNASGADEFRFDAGTEALIDIVLKDALSSPPQRTKLIKYIFDKLNSMQTEEEARAFAVDQLRELVAETEPGNRVEALLAVRDFLKS